MAKVMNTKLKTATKDKVVWQELFHVQPSHDASKDTQRAYNQVSLNKIILQKKKKK
jgi:hypothetical protein